MKKVSIIVAAYNVEQYIEKCLLSIKNQTYSNIEVLVVNDGSKDNTRKIIDRFVNDDNRFYAIHKENAGPGYARNDGMDAAQGEYILFVDGDDFIEQDMVETLVKYREKNNSDMVTCGYKRYIDDSHIKDVTTTSQEKNVAGFDEIVENILAPIIGNDISNKKNDRREMCLWTNLYSAEIIRNNNLRFVSDREYLSEDFFFNILYIKNCRKVTLISECLYNYRFNPQSLTNAYRPEKIGLINVLIERSKALLDENGLSKYCGKRLENLYFMKLRHAILQVSAAPNIKIAEKVQIITDAINTNQCLKAISDYPINNSKVTDRIMLFLIKHKLSVLLYVYMTMQAKMLSARDKF